MAIRGGRFTLGLFLMLLSQVAGIVALIGVLLNEPAVSGRGPHVWLWAPVLFLASGLWFFLSSLRKQREPDSPRRPLRQFALNSAFAVALLVLAAILMVVLIPIAYMLLIALSGDWP